MTHVMVDPGVGFELFQFQAEDVLKLKGKLSCLIGNDPGTGKTYEGIALDTFRRNGEGHPKVDLDGALPLKTLIVTPSVVMDAWDEHCMELTDLDVYVIDPKNREPFIKALLDPRRGGYFIVHWEGLRIIEPRLTKAKLQVFHVIADECHKAKNEKAQQTRALKKIKTTYKTGMSGTWADNKIEDAWSVLNWLWPKYYTSKWRFVNAYVIVTEEETRDGTGYKKLWGPNEENLPHLKREMAPWYVRRRKEDVLPDLPDKYYTKIKVDLHPKQRKQYDQMKKTMIAWIETHREEIEREDPLIAQATVSQLVRLQQFACGTMEPLLDDKGDIVLKFVHKGHKKGEGKKPPHIIDTCTEKCGYKEQWIMVDPSSKLDAVMQLLEDRGEEQIIIWSQYKSVIDLLARRLEASNIRFGLLTGDTKKRARTEHIQAFQSGRIRVIAGTVATGGVGITLTAASTVLFIDRTWSPAINLQAEDRAHRIGQTSAVEIIDLIARNTVDLGKHQKLRLKWRWLRLLFGDIVPTEELVKELEEEEAA